MNEMLQDIHVDSCYMHTSELGETVPSIRCSLYPWVHISNNSAGKNEDIKVVPYKWMSLPREFYKQAATAHQSLPKKKDWRQLDSNQLSIQSRKTRQFCPTENRSGRQLNLAAFTVQALR